MALKNYHFSSIASVKVTLGDPLIRQIIDASKVINTPITTCAQVTQGYEQAAKMVKGRNENNYLEAVGSPPSLHSYKIPRPHPHHHPLLAKPHMIIPFSKHSSFRDDNYISIRLDQETIGELRLELTIDGIINTIVKGKRKSTLQDIRVIRNRIRIYNARDGRGGRSSKKTIRKSSYPCRICGGSYRSWR